VLQHLNHHAAQDGWPLQEYRLDSDKLEVLRARLQS
jgi:hypothetical protein